MQTKSKSTQSIVSCPAELLSSFFKNGNRGEIILIRGIPGSGKSSLALRLCHLLDLDYLHMFEADMYHLDEKQEYAFDPSKIKDSHHWCQQSTRIFLARQMVTAPVIVSNTFTTIWEMQFYFDLAKTFKRKVVVTEPNTDWAKNVEQCFYKCLHDVPRETIQKMLDRWEKLYGVETFSGHSKKSSGTGIEVVQERSEPSDLLKQCSDL